MNHIKNFYIVVWVMDGTEEAPGNSPLAFCWLAVIPHYTKREAFTTLFNTLAKNLDYYAKPKVNRDHDFMVAVKTGTYTVCMDLLKEAEYQEYAKKIETGELVPNDLLIREKEIAESNKTTTLVVGHSWDDDPNNGVPDFTEFDCVFMVDLGVGKRVTAIYSVPEMLGLDLQYLRYDAGLTERVKGDDGTEELQSFSFSNKYERWQFQIAKYRINDLASDNAIRNNHGYVTLPEACKIVAQCVQEKEARREANHRMLLDAEMASLSNVEDLLKHLKSRM